MERKKPSRPATMITIGIEAASFSCKFNGKSFASGHIVTRDECGRGFKIDWVAACLKSKWTKKWTVAPTGGRARFSLSLNLNKRITDYIVYQILKGMDVEFDVDVHQKRPEMILAEVAV